MKALFNKYKSVVRFVALFLGTYLLLSICYSVYLNLSDGGKYPPDFVTHLVAKQSKAVISGFGYNAQVVPHDSEPTMKLYIDDTYLARIIEGCNALSIIILFIAFVIAFAERFKKTLLFLLAGMVLIYSVNVARIAVLAISLYHYPQHEKILHSVVFPGLIYGMVFVLWILWVRMLSPVKQTHEQNG